MSRTIVSTHHGAQCRAAGERGRRGVPQELADLGGCPMSHCAVVDSDPCSPACACSPCCCSSRFPCRESRRQRARCATTWAGPYRTRFRQTLRISVWPTATTTGTITPVSAEYTSTIVRRTRSKLGPARPWRSTGRRQELPNTRSASTTKHARVAPHVRSARRCRRRFSRCRRSRLLSRRSHLRPS